MMHLEAQVIIEDVSYYVFVLYKHRAHHTTATNVLPQQSILYHSKAHSQALENLSTE